MSTHKYNAKRTECAVGHVHPSKAEAKRCDELQELEREGTISALDLEPAFPIVINGTKVCTYKADFEYIDEHGERAIEDVKGRPTPIYRLKKKLVEASYPGVKIREVRR